MFRFDYTSIFFFLIERHFRYPKLYAIHAKVETIFTRHKRHERATEVAQIDKRNLIIYKDIFEWSNRDSVV